MLALLIYPFVGVGPELRRRAYRWTRPSGGVRRGHCLRGSLGVHQITGKCAIIDDVIMCSAEGALGGNGRQKHGKTSGSFLGVFSTLSKLSL